MSRLGTSVLVLVASASGLAACGGGGGNPQPTFCGSNSGMGTLQDFSVPCDPGGGGVLFSASGEVLALGGYPFPNSDPNGVVFVDGWAITYDRVLTTFDHVTLSLDPDKSPTDQSQCDDGSGGSVKCGTGASVVAEVDGPFAVDLHKGGSLMGKGGGDEQAVPVAALTGMNKDGNAAFDPTMRYAFGFEVVPATLSANNIDLDAADLTDYQEMVTKGYTTFLIGTATWQGNEQGALGSDNGGCTSTIAAYDFSKIPTTIKFRIGLTAPTVYRNAQNPDNDPAKPLGDEEHERGISVTANASTVAQLTFHLDHAFWESFVHDSPAHFDSFAAKYAGTTAPTLVLEDFKGYAFTPFVDALGNQVPWRSCVPPADYTPPTQGAMTFDTLTIPVNPTGDPATSIRDFYDYTLYNHSTFGHLNSDGLSFVDRQYASPP